MGALALGCSTRAPADDASSAVDARAAALAERAEHEFSAGRIEDGLAVATRALVVRLAHYGVESPQPAESFVQLGDMRRRLGQTDWARQCYRRALELAAPHERTHPRLVRIAATRLAAIYEERGDRATAERLRRRYASAQGGAAP